MKTLTATQARKNLTALLNRAKRGEDIGIISGDSVIALRPVQVFSEDYAMTEYGLTKEELDRAYKKIGAEIKRERKAGKLKEFDL
jgi:antitoxin (DNA-binding transcriptional repressor) of toxin-antitoxin stability system